jgi:hypothetical protein
MAKDPFEGIVKRDSFGEIMAMLTENVMGMVRISNDVFDLALRNMRVPSRRDITRLAEQLARTEDKLETVLQEVEALRDEVSSQPAPSRSRSSNGSGSSSSRRKTNARSRS